jgi:LuxR family maltose regulon positive regulatory protein
MPRKPLHTLVWSRESSLYEFYTQGQIQQRFRPGEEAAWQTWLGEATSFAFQGACGKLNAYHEARPRGGRYWYAYHTTGKRVRKRYLGQTANISFVRLEEAAQFLSRESALPLTASSSTPQQDKSPMPLLSTKLAPPRLPRVLVERKHLLVALDGALVTPLTLIAAPAGWGKTTLLSAWASRHRAQVAWLSLDELDNSPTRFWVSLIAALRQCGRCGPSFGETVVALLSSPQSPPLVACLAALLSELDGSEAPPAHLVLIVDDYHVLSDPALHEGMSFFLEHLPAHLHLILSSRVDPDLPLARWRARGQLAEIRMDELRFGEAEANYYLGQMLSTMLSTEEVSRLLRRTEGWIAGLQLAALAVQKREDRAAFLQALTGSQRYLLDYVQEEILARLPTPVRDFLLHTSILSHMSASVCQAVTAEPERRASQQMLVFLERANLFLVPLDGERRSYRLHELFREALLSVLHTTSPELVPLLHRRAAGFYEAEGQWAEAIAHWLAAADFSAAARLMEETIEQFWLRGEAATMARWVLALPEQQVRVHAHLLLRAALYLLSTGWSTAREQRTRVHQQVRQLMARVETALGDRSNEVSSQISAIEADAGAAFSPEDLEALAAKDALLHRRLRLLRMYLVLEEATANWDDERLSHMQQEIEGELEREEETVWQMIPLACSFILHYSFWREGASLVPQLLFAKEPMSRKGSPYVAIAVRRYLALAAVRAGQLRLAYEESQAALDLIERLAGYVLPKGYFQIAQVEVWYQWNRLEEARDLLQRVIHTAVIWQQLDLLSWGYVELLQVALATGDGSLAEFALHEVEQLVRHERFGFYPGLLPTLRAQWWLAQGQVREASDWAAGVAFSEEPWERNLYDAFPVVIRVYFAEHRWTEAASLLGRWRRHLDRPANLEITIIYLAQSLVALHQTGKLDQAREVAARLFALTEPEGYLRVYLDLGEPMKHALKALLSAPPNTQSDAGSASFARSYVVRLLALFEQEESLAATRTPHSGQTFALTPESLPPPAKEGPLPIEPLSPQEIKVLRLLVAGHTYAEMAGRLIVSIHTIKTQVSSIYRKLGVSRRAEAIAASRQFHHL